jgi:hypothetical protein
MAIGSRIRDRLGGDIVACAGLVFDDEGLVQPRREPLPDQASQRICQAAWRGGDTNRTGRVG